MERKNLRKAFRFTMTVLFFTFLALYFSQASGYIEYSNRKKVDLTEEKIKQFEEDVKEGKEIDMKDYLDTDDKDYQNNISKMGLKLSEMTEGGVSKVIEESFKLLGKIAE